MKSSKNTWEKSACIYEWIREGYACSNNAMIFFFRLMKVYWCKQRVRLDVGTVGLTLCIYFFLMHDTILGCTLLCRDVTIHSISVKPVGLN